MTAFPNQYVTLAVVGNGHASKGDDLDPDESYAARAAGPGRLIVQNYSLATFNHPRPAPERSSRCSGRAG